MKCLIVENDSISIQVLKGLISRYVQTSDIAIDGQEGIDLFLQAHESNSPYGLDIDGHYDAGNKWLAVCADHSRKRNAYEYLFYPTGQNYNDYRARRPSHRFKGIIRVRCQYLSG